MSPKRVDKGQKREQIARAAVEVFSIKGFERTRMEDVAAEADVGKGTLYEYYEDKEALLHGAFELLMGGMLEDLGSRIRASESPPLTKIAEMTRDMVEAMARLQSTYRFFLEYMLHTSRAQQGYPYLRQMLRGFRAEVRCLLEEGIRLGDVRQDVDPGAAAAAFLAWFDGAIFHWVVLPDDVGLGEMAEQFLQMIVRGLSSGDLRDPEAVP